MLDHILKYLEYAGGLISFFAVIVIVAGLTLAIVRYAIHFLSSSQEADFGQLKIWLARPLTLGLEVLVLADVIETITVKPSFDSLVVLAFLVVVRTMLNWTLCLEMEGRWPWQTPTKEGESG